MAKVRISQCILLLNVSYHIHTTDAFIVSTTLRGERNSSLLLLTEELGTLYAHAQGVRVLQSKLRPHIIEHALTRISLVRGKAEWRVVGAESIARLDRLPSVPRASLLRLLSLAAHTTVPDDPHTNHFLLIREAYTVLSEAPIAMVPVIELLTVLKIVADAGFLPEDPHLSPYLSLPLSLSNAQTFEPLLTHGLSVANNALKQIR